MTDRINKLQAKLHENEGALITDAADRLYLTGFPSSAGIVFVTAKSALFIIDFRYFEKAKREVSGAEVILPEDVKTQLCNVISAEKITEIFVRTECMSMSEFRLYNKMLDGILSESRVLDSIMTELRSIKTCDEIENIRCAQAFTEQTFDYILGRIESGRTEREIMLDMEFFMRRLGSDGVAFDFIVVSGKNSSLPHGVPTDKRVCAGDFVTMDFGAVYNGYRSDMTRTVAVGQISERQRAVYETVLNAQSMALEAIEPGRICRDIDAVARNYINDSGYGGCFGHGLGHSVGVEIHENPSFNTRCDTVLLPGMVMTVEPGIYLQNEFGVRIEDMVVVTEDGCEDITHSPKELIVL
ncbi:MAG: aminopeptidase P family protein [Clostridia bacterium]|nr:aminopeptidase P family protein [Clostridia bacterium]